MKRIVVGDVYKYKEWVAVILSQSGDGCVNILFSDGDITPIEKSDFFEKFQKIGHIDKFAEVIKELKKMTEISEV